MPTKADTQTANKHMKRRSTSYIIREIQVKTIYTTYLLERPKSRKLTPPNAAVDVE